MSKIRRLEKIEDTQYMKAKISDNSVYYVDASYTSHAHQCMGCGLVWDRRNLAEACESKGHRQRYEVTYGGRFENGRHVGGAKFERRAIRRERIEQQPLFSA